MFILLYWSQDRMKIIELMYDFVYVSQNYDKNNKKCCIHVMLGNIWEWLFKIHLIFHIRLICGLNPNDQSLYCCQASLLWDISFKLHLKNSVLVPNLARSRLHCLKIFCVFWISNSSQYWDMYCNRKFIKMGNVPNMGMFVFNELKLYEFMVYLSYPSTCSNFFIRGIWNLYHFNFDDFCGHCSQWRKLATMK